MVVVERFQDMVGQATRYNKVGKLISSCAGCTSLFVKATLPTMSHAVKDIDRTPEYDQFMQQLRDFHESKGYAMIPPRLFVSVKAHPIYSIL